MNTKILGKISVCILIFVGFGNARDKGMQEWRVRPLAQNHVEIYRSPDPQNIFCVAPGVALCPNGRLVVTAGIRGKNLSRFEGPKFKGPRKSMQGKVFTSDDHGKSWTHRVNFPFMHARPFVSGQSVYVLGQANDLTIIRSDDRGQTWSEPAKLTEGENWHQAPSNVHYANGHIYLVMEKRIAHRVTGWAPGEFAPVLMRAKIGDDLTRRENWTFASELAFCDVVCDRDLDYFGVPFFPVWYPNCKTLVPGRHICPMGWLETNVVQFTDPDHVWHDPAGRTFHLWMRANTTMTGYACIAQVKEHADGSMTTSLVKSPSDKKMVFVPCPGGQNKFHVLYDEKTAQYWLVSVQSRDSMTKPEKLSPLRFNEPANERRWLQLHFSKNMIDWQFAGLVAQGAADNAARHYASMAIDGDDLHILSRSGDVNAKSAHDGNITTFHTIKDFRNLLY